MLTLLTFAPALGTRCPSPFALKAEALLTMSGVEFRKEIGNLLKMPRKKLPVLDVSTRLVPDSAHIQSYLETQHGANFDAGLSTADMAIANGYRRLIEHHLYFLNVHFRWLEHGEAVKQGFFGDVPSPLRGFVFRKVQKGVSTTLHLQGMGRHTRDELVGFFQQDLDSLSHQLANKPFLLGDTPTSIDASLYGALHNIIECDLDTPGKQHALKLQNLVDYCSRFRQTVFHD